MKLERSIATDLAESTIVERLATYFAFAGYEQSIAQPHVMAFRRGRHLSLTARGCPVNAVIQLAGGPEHKTHVQVTLEIDTGGQFVVEFERKYWGQQMDDIEKAVLLGKVE